ncbi:hypothetical protein ES703_74225 [subsurface metagenome]
MGILEDQRESIWRAIEFWRREKRLSTHHLSLLTAGKTKEPYTPDRIGRGITDGSEPISSDLVHACVEIFGLVVGPVSARGKSPKDTRLKDEECVELLTAPLRRTQQGELWD